MEVVALQQEGGIVGLHFHAFAGVVRPDPVDQFGEGFLFVHLVPWGCVCERINGTILPCNG